MNDILITLEDISCHYGDRSIFSDVSFGIHASEKIGIVGINGSGKTTLSNLFRALELRKQPEGEVTLTTANSSITGNEFAQSTLPVRVFNRDFVAANVFPVGGGEVPPIFVLGEESAEKQAQVEQLKEEKTSAQGTIDAAKHEKAKAEKALDKHCVDRATIIRETLRSSGDNPYNNYDKARYKLTMLRKGGGDAMVELRHGMEQALADLKSAFAKAKGKF